MTVEYLRRDGLPSIAYCHNPPSPGSMLPTVVFLGGYAQQTDMQGTKAQFLLEQCTQQSQGCVLFDYRGHGQSEGDFEKSTLGDWLDDTLAIINHCTKGPLILVGSSMGGWLALLVALQSDRVKGIIGIAAAPDFSQWQCLDRFTPEQTEALKHDGKVEIPTGDDRSPSFYTLLFLNEANNHLLLSSMHSLAIPITLLQGTNDDAGHQDIPQRMQEAFPQAQIQIIFSEGDHSFSSPKNLALIEQALQAQISPENYLASPQVPSV